MPTATEIHNRTIDRPLTEKQSLFVEHYLQSANARESAERAGYAASVAKNAYREILGSSTVKRAVAEGIASLQQASHKRLSIGVSKMLDMLEEITQDPTVAAGVRVQAANSWLDRASFQRGSDEGNAYDDLKAQELDDILASI